MAPAKRSIAREFYKKTNNVVAECTICKNSVKNHRFTSNLMEHLKRKHHQYLELHKMAVDLESTDQPAISQSNVTSHPTTSVSDVSKPSLFYFQSTNNVNEIGLTFPIWWQYLSSRASQVRHQVFQVRHETLATRSRRSFQTTIAGTMKLKELPSKKLKQIDNLLVGTVAEGYLPFALVENKKFVELIKELEPRYSLLSRKTFTRRLLLIGMLS